MAGLVADYGSDSEDQNSSDSSSESDDTHSDENEDDVKIENIQEKLPLPDILSDKRQPPGTEFRSNKTDDTSNSSVFFNPFKAKEDEKLAILERHVKLTERKEETKTEKGKFRRSKKFQRRQNFDQQSQRNGDDDGSFRTFGKRRVGVNDTLVPPKKALKAYEKQRREETRT